MNAPKPVWPFKGSEKSKEIASIECLKYKSIMSSHKSIPIKRTFSGFPTTLENSLKAKHHMQENMQANIFANDTYTKNRA